MKSLSRLETVWLLMQGYTCIYNQSQDRLAQIIVLRI